MNIRWIQKNSVYLVALAVVLGMVVGLLYDMSFLKGFMALGLIIMVVPVMVNVKVGEILEAGKDLKIVVMALVFNFLIIPLLAWFLGGIWFSGHPEFALGLLLISLIPTGGMTASWVGLAKGDTHGALVIIVLSLLLSIIAVPLEMGILGGTWVKMNPWKVFYQLVWIVFVPLVLGNGIRKVIVKIKGKQYFQSVSKDFPSISMLGVIFVVFTSVAIKAKTLWEKPDILIILVPGILMLYGTNYLISTLVGRTFFKRERGIAFMYGTVMKNLTIAMAVAVVSFDPLVSLLIAVAYLVQVPTAVFYLHHIQKIFPKEK